METSFIRTLAEACVDRIREGGRQAYVIKGSPGQDDHAVLDISGSMTLFITEGKALLVQHVENNTVVTLPPLYDPDFIPKLEEELERFGIYLGSTGE